MILLRRTVILTWLLVTLVLAGRPLCGVDTSDTLLLTNPAISASQIAFVYDRDVWVAGLDGKSVRRLTTQAGTETNPRFSPDGSLLAFSAQYDGNTDVFVVPAAGGVPKRLTWHPAEDIVAGFAPAGDAILFRSPRQVFTSRHTQLFTVPLVGGFPTALDIPHAHKAAYSPDGKRLAYTPLAERFEQWKNYRGGTTSRIWLYRFSDHAVEQIPQPAERCNDTDPMWIGDSVYFISDRNGEFNLFAYHAGTKEIVQLTDHKDFPVLTASSGGGKIVYEQAGRLHVFDPAKKAAETLRIGVAAELLETRPRFVKGADHIRDVGISPTGKRVVFECRGEIVTVPAGKGDPRNLTESPGAHERSPAWSPDGTSIAYFSDASGEYELHVQRQDDRRAVKKYKLSGSGFYEQPVWSPDSKRIAYADNSLSYHWIDLETGVSKKFAQQPLYGPSRSRTNDFSWSPDSKWIAYALVGRTYFRTVYAYSLEKEKSFRITDGMSDALEPVFDASGKYLYFFASTDAGPVRQWFDMSNADMRVSRSIYLAVLREDLPSPLAAQSDEEEPGRTPAAESVPDAPADPKTGRLAPEPVRIDFERIDQRILSLPLHPREYVHLQPGKPGELYYLEMPAERGEQAEQRKGGDLKRFLLDKRAVETVLSPVSAYWLSADRRQLLTKSESNWSINSVGGMKSGPEKLNVAAIEVRIDPRAEWEQMFTEAWRINRDFFYAPNFHGADWPAMRAKYAVLLPHLATRSDLNRVIQWMGSELAVGHHRVGGGQRLDEPKSVPVGLLGADYAIADNRYRFKKVYGGLNWSPDLRSPLTAPGVNVKAGEYLLAVNGRDLQLPTNVYSLFENTADKIVELSVGPRPDGKEARKVKVVPLASEAALRNRDWVEGNIRKVDQATGGRVAYVYVPNTSTLGHVYFKRYFFPQADKQAMILDERFNSGGQMADYYIDHLRKPLIAHWAMRYGEDMKTPSASIQGPKVMLIDETAGSGGDLLPWMFRKLGLGPLVGKRTWGGLVGILGFPVLMDGGTITAPDLAIWSEEGWVVENVGVPPDVEVEQWPADVIAGRDPQLEKAIAILVEQLNKNPPQPAKRPPYPVRVRPQ